MKIKEMYEQLAYTQTIEPSKPKRMSVWTILVFAVLDISTVAVLAFLMICIARSRLLTSAFIGAFSTFGAMLMHAVYHDIWLFRGTGFLGTDGESEDDDDDDDDDDFIGDSPYSGY